MINLACIVITDDMDRAQILAALDQPGAVILDARTGTVSESVPELIGIYNNAKRNHTTPIPEGRNRPGKITFAD